MPKEIVLSEISNNIENKFGITKIPDLLQNLPLDRLFKSMDDSVFKDSLVESTRYKKFFYFPDFGDNDRIWMRWVEPHTSIGQHQRDFVEWSIAFHSLERNSFSVEEQRKGILADAIHDIGEVKIDGVIFVGDIPRDRKTSKDEKLEVKVAHQAIEMLNLDGIGLTKEELHQVYDEVVVGSSHKLHQAHKAREKWDYVRTGIDLVEKAESSNFDYKDFPIYSLDWFITKIMTDDLPEITNGLARYYPKSIGNQLIRNEKQIETAFQRSQKFLDERIAGKRKFFINDDYEKLQKDLNKSFKYWRIWD